MVIKTQKRKRNKGTPAASIDWSVPNPPHGFEDRFPFERPRRDSSEQVWLKLMLRPDSPVASAILVNLNRGSVLGICTWDFCHQYVVPHPSGLICRLIQNRGRHSSLDPVESGDMKILPAKESQTIRCHGYGFNLEQEISSVTLRSLNTYLL
ncbi:hypothetical protein PSHT_10016 [Puccinia striiformis]|uniref:Uncharacterized protein n=1 Tax=Puccinia striiformis TaxID=27350 RepID=A0A2S4VCN2_9BASI|nr:hypothetical protein PSHT_10016 [Puccinia striiformis]